jgi:hypothetical protein
MPTRYRSGHTKFITRSRRIPVGNQIEQHAIGHVFSALRRHNDLFKVLASLFPAAFVGNLMVLTIGCLGVPSRKLVEEPHELFSLGL